MKLKLDWFLTGMALAIGLAWLLPDPGSKGGALHPELLNKAGVALKRSTIQYFSQPAAKGFTLIELLS